MFSRAKWLLACVALLAGTGIPVINGCTVVEELYYDCNPDARRPSPDCIDGGADASDAHADSQIAPMSCKAAGGVCVPMGTSDYRERAVLLWMGDELEAPECPERADSVFYTGYSDLIVSFECAKCACAPAACVLPNEITVEANNFCPGANGAAYAAPTGWDGSCVSPSVLPPGSFSSIKLSPASIAPCEPVGDPSPEPPGFASGSTSFTNGIYWGKFAKACQGSVNGQCENTGELCLPSAEPPPPGFRQCVQYALPVDESELPQCPTAFPDRFVFYAGTDGKIDCSPCECGAPIGAKCKIAWSAYQDVACGNVPDPLFEFVPAVPGLCIDFGAEALALGSIEAQWINNEPGTCEPSGGEFINEVKAVDPRVFCCQAPPSAEDK